MLLRRCVHATTFQTSLLVGVGSLAPTARCSTNAPPQPLNPLSQQLKAILAPASQYATAKARLVASGALLKRHATPRGGLTIHPMVALEMIRLLTQNRVDGSLSWFTASVSPVESRMEGDDGLVVVIVEALLQALRELVASPAAAVLVGAQGLRLALGVLMLRECVFPNATCAAHGEHVVVASVALSLRQGSVLKFVPTAEEVLQIAFACATAGSQQAAGQSSTEDSGTPSYVYLLRFAHRVQAGGFPQPPRLREETAGYNGFMAFVGEQLLFPQRTPTTPYNVWWSASCIRDVHGCLCEGGRGQGQTPETLRVPLAIPDDARLRQVLMQLAQVEYSGSVRVLVDIALPQDGQHTPSPSADVVGVASLRLLLPLKAWLDVALAPNAPTRCVQLSFTGIVAVLRHCLEQLQDMSEVEPKRLLEHKPRIHALKETITLVQQATGTPSGATLYFPDEDARAMERVLRELGHRARHFVRRAMTLKASAVREDGVLGALLTGGVERSDLEADAMLRNASFRVIEPLIKRLYMCLQQHRWWAEVDAVLGEVHQHAGTHVHASEVFTLRHPLQCSQIALVETWRTVALKTMAQLIAEIQKRTNASCVGDGCGTLGDAAAGGVGGNDGAIASDRGAASHHITTTVAMSGTWLQAVLLLDGALDALLQRLQDEADVAPSASSEASQERHRVSICAHRTLGLLLVHVALLCAVGRDAVRWPSDPWPMCSRIAQRAMERGVQLGDPCVPNAEAAATAATDDDEPAYPVVDVGGSGGGLHWMQSAGMRAWAWAQRFDCTQREQCAIRNGLMRGGVAPTSQAEVGEHDDGPQAVAVVTAGSYEARLSRDASFSGVGAVAVPWSAGASASQPLRFYDEDGSSQRATEHFDFLMAKVHEAAMSRRMHADMDVEDIDESDSCSATMGSGRRDQPLRVVPLSLVDEIALLMS